METSYNCTIRFQHVVPKVNSSIVSKGAMKSLKEMFPLAVMHIPSHTYLMNAQLVRTKFQVFPTFDLFPQKVILMKGLSHEHLQKFFTAKTQKESNRQVFFSKIWQMCVFGKITPKLFLKTSYWMFWEPFCKNSKRLLVNNCFRKMLHFRCLTGFWIRLCKSDSKFTRYYGFF